MFGYNNALFGETLTPSGADTRFAICIRHQTVVLDYDLKPVPAIIEISPTSNGFVVGASIAPAMNDCT